MTPFLNLSLPHCTPSPTPLHSVPHQRKGEAKIRVRPGHLSASLCKQGCSAFWHCDTSLPSTKFTLQNGATELQKVKSHNVLSKFTVSHSAAFIVVPSCVQSSRCRLDAPASGCHLMWSQRSPPHMTGFVCLFVWPSRCSKTLPQDLGAC